MDPQGEVVPYLAAGALIMYAQSWLKRFHWYKAFVTASRMPRSSGTAPGIS